MRKRIAPDRERTPMCIFRPRACFLGILLIRQGFCDPKAGVSREAWNIGSPAFLLSPILAFPLTKTGGKLGCLLALFLVPLSWFVGVYAFLESRVQE